MMLIDRIWAWIGDGFRASMRFALQEALTLLVLFGLVAVAVVGSLVVGEQIYPEQRQEDASGIGNSTTAEASRPSACKEASEATKNEDASKDRYPGEQLALRQYCASVRANELATRNLSLSGFATLISMLSMVFAVIALVVSIRVGRREIDRTAAELDRPGN